MIDWNDQPAIEEVFTVNIKPHLHELEEQREIAKNESNKLWKKALVMVVIPTTLVSFGLIYIFTHPKLILAICVAAGVAVISAVLGHRHAHTSSRAYESELRELFMKHVCEALGDLNYKRIGSGFGLLKFEQYKLIKKHDDANLEDWLFGSYNGYDFNIVEARLTKEVENYDDEGSDTNTKTLFDGILIKLETPLRTTGVVSIIRDKGKLSNKFSGLFKKGKKVEIPNEEFESLFEVYAEYPESAASLFTSTVIELFISLPDILKTKNLSIAIDNSLMLIAAGDTKPFLEEFSIHMDPLHYQDIFENVIQECAIACRIINQLDKSSSTNETHIQAINTETPQ